MRHPSRTLHVVIGVLFLAAMVVGGRTAWIGSATAQTPEACTPASLPSTVPPLCQAIIVEVPDRASSTTDPSSTSSSNTSTTSTIPSTATSVPDSSATTALDPTSTVSTVDLGGGGNGGGGGNAGGGGGGGGGSGSAGQLPTTGAGSAVLVLTALGLALMQVGVAFRRWGRRRGVDGTAVVPRP